LNKTPVYINPFHPEVIYFSELDSSSLELKRLLERGTASHGTCVRAGFQSAGRGQAGSFWAGNAGENLYLSLLIELSLPVEQQFRLNTLVAIAIAETLELEGIDVKIKWPNDIFCQNKKMGGILMENQVQGSSIRSSIIGIGINLNQTDFGSFRATSVFSVKGQKTHIPTFARKLLEQLQWRLMGLNSRELYLEEYYKRLLFFGEETTFFTGSRLFRGKVEGTDNWGRIRIKEDDKTSFFSPKEIKWIDL
jgi:BirA family biotin operon repressor/biotin-[acetyl-CoA-carboxylase] ligase